MCIRDRVCVRLTEEFQLHLLKLPGTECKVSGRNLVAEGLADLADAEWHLLPGSSLYLSLIHILLSTLSSRKEVSAWNS